MGNIAEGIYDQRIRQYKDMGFREREAKDLAENDLMEW